MKRATTWLVALAVLPTFAAAATTERARFLMGTTCEIATDGAPAQIEAAFAETARIESFLSTWIAESELSRVNRGEAAPSPELRALLDEALEWSRRTNRAFDPRWRGSFDEGGFGKGYAIDRMMAVLASGAAGSQPAGTGRRAESPPLHLLINFGGQLAVRGSMRVTIADPKDRQHPVLELTLANASLSTSSNSEQMHLVDPRTGEHLPRRGSASVIAADALTADILSTALFVMGAGDGLRWADANGVAAIFITPGNHIRLSSSARGRGAKVIDGHFAMKD
jgi:thiamine biosynthesis lipoprotein